MVKPNYIPNRGDLVWLTFDPALGHEEAGRRPALVLSPKEYNGKTNMAMCCPVTKSVKGYAFEVDIMIRELKCAILADHVKALDWTKRSCRFIEKISGADLENVQGKIIKLVRD